MLSATQVAEIYSLADKGVQAYYLGRVTGYGNEYVALQDAIWEIQYPGLAITANPTIDALAAGFPALANPPACPYCRRKPHPRRRGYGHQPLERQLGQALVLAPGPNMGEGLLGFAAMTALLIGARYRGLFV